MKFLRWRTISNFAGDPYLFRLTLFSCKYFGVFLHKILRSDSDRDLHDHPWPFMTFLLSGRYAEDVPSDSPPMFNEQGCMYTKTRLKSAGSLIFHKATDAHCLTLPGIWDHSGLEPKVIGYQPVWSLFIHGPRRRQWGFHTAQGWIDWETYIANREVDLAPMEDC